MKKCTKILSVLGLTATVIASTLATGFSIKNVVQASTPTEELLYTLDFTDIPRENLDENNVNSINANDKHFIAWEERKLNELKARGFEMGSEFNLGGHDSKFFYQTNSQFFHTANLNPSIDPYAFFLKFEAYTRFEKKLDGERRVKIYVDPVEYYYHGSVTEKNDGTGNYYDMAGSNYVEEIKTLKTRSEAVTLKINDIPVSDNITGVIEASFPDKDAIKITQDIKGVTVYKMEFYGYKYSNNPLQVPDDSTVIDDKLLYTYDFTQVDEKYLNPYNDNGVLYPAVSASAAHSGFVEMESIWRDKIKNDGWVLGEFEIFDHSSSSFYQTVPGNLFRNEKRDPYAFGVKCTSKFSMTKVKTNETRIKIYIDPVDFYHWGKLGYGDGELHTTLRTRTEPYKLRISNKIISDNATGVIECDLSDTDMISISQANVDSSDASVIYKIEVYGIEEADSSTEQEESFLNKVFSQLGMPGLTLGVQIAVIIAGIMIVKKILK